MTEPSNAAPMTEEQLRAVTIGDLKSSSGPTFLADYDPEWPVLFEREADRLRTALGDAALGVRDRLRANEPDRRHYEGAKRELARQDWKYVQNYADAKSAVVEEIIARAGSETSDEL